MATGDWRLAIGESVCGGLGIALAICMFAFASSRSASSLHRHAAMSLLLVAALLACRGDRSVGPAQSIVGAWDGSAVLGTVQFSATFTQSGDSVGGSGSFTSPLASGPFVVAGSLQGSNVDLVLTSSQLGATKYAGHFTNSGTITGRLDAPNYSDIQLTLERRVTKTVGDTP
jgi:hypothetical protein